MGLTKPRASQIFDLDYKQATRVITVSDVTLTGGAPAVVDGVTLNAGDRVLVTGQTTGSENGLYAVSVVGVGEDGTWVRTSDGNEDGEISAGMIIMVTEGTTYADTQWKLTTNDPIDIGVTSLNFVINILSDVGGANTQVQINDAGTLGGFSNFTFDKTTNVLSVTGNIVGTNISGSGAGLTNIPAANVTGTLSVNTGGTGTTSLPLNNVLLGNDTSAVQAVAPGSNGNVLTSDGATWISSVPASGGLTYVVKTTNYTAQNNEGVLADTSGGSFTVTLPETPTSGDQVVIADGTDSFATNNLTVGRNGNTIEGIAEDLICDINGVSITFIYNGTTWSIYTQIGAQSGVVVTEDGIQTLTNKTLVDPTIQNYTESVVAIGTVSTTHTFDLTNGTMQTATLTASTACTFTMPTAAPGKSFMLILNQAPTTGNGTATFTGVLWAGGSAPTITAAAGSADMISFVSDGTNWYGSASQDFQ